MRADPYHADWKNYEGPEKTGVIELPEFDIPPKSVISEGGKIGGRDFILSLYLLHKRQ